MMFMFSAVHLSWAFFLRTVLVLKIPAAVATMHSALADLYTKNTPSDHNESNFPHLGIGSRFPKMNLFSKLEADNS